MNLNFSMSELIKSDTAKKYGINNMPSDSKILDNMMELIINCLQPIRNYVQRPIIVNSGYRCPALNAKVGGVANSEHLSGCACDIVCDSLTVQQLISKIKASGIEYNQLIDEKHWVHISYCKGKNKKQYFKI